MKDVIHPLNHVPHDLLQILDLDVCIKHQQRVWYRHIDSLDCIVISLTRCIAVLLRRTGAEVLVVTCITILPKLGWVRSMYHYLMGHACVWVYCSWIRYNCTNLMRVASRLWLARVVIRDVSRIDHPARSLGRNILLRIDLLSVLINIPLRIDSLRYLLLHELLLLKIYLGILLLIDFLEHLLTKICTCLHFFSLATHLILSHHYLPILSVLGLLSLRHHCLHYESSLSFLCRPW